MSDSNLTRTDQPGKVMTYYRSGFSTLLIFGLAPILWAILQPISILADGARIIFGLFWLFLYFKWTRSPYLTINEDYLIIDFGLKKMKLPLSSIKNPTIKNSLLFFTHHDQGLKADRTLSIVNLKKETQNRFIKDLEQAIANKKESSQNIG